MSHILGAAFARFARLARHTEPRPTMAEDERTIARALRGVTFCPGIATKRFARNMADAAERADAPALTTKQRAALISVAIRFRRQVPADVVALARAMQAAA